MSSNGHDQAALIDSLVGDLRPVGAAALPRRTLTALVAGALVSLLVVLGLWGVRPDIVAALSGAAFWIKETFVLVLVVAGFAAVLRLSRPDGRAAGPAALALGAFLALAAMAAIQFAITPQGLWRHLLMGATAAVCPWLIIALSGPILAGALAMMRRMAPTRLRRAGAAAGFAAGALSALVYSVSCDESAMPFILVWYGGAIAVVTVIGAALGPKVLRW